MAKFTFTIAGNSFEIPAKSEMIATMMATDRARALGFAQFYWVECQITGGFELQTASSLHLVDISDCAEIRAVEKVATGSNGIPHLYIRRAQLAELVA